VERDLTWTGNQFLDPRGQMERFVAAVEALDLTNKDDVWSEAVARAAADYHGLDPSRVRVAAGATQSIDAVLRTLYRGLVVDVTPNFHLTATVSRQEGWNYTAVPVRERADLLACLEPYLDREGVVISLSSPRNPLGYQFSLDDIAALAERTRGHVLVDEVYADFASDSALRLVDRYPNLVVFRTFSKAWGLANLRIGFAVSAAFADPDFALRLLPNSVSGVAQRAARYVLAHPEAVESSIREAQAGRDRMIAELAGIPDLFVWPSDANYLCLESPVAEDIVKLVGEAGYEVRVVNELRGYPEGWPTGVRIVVPPEPDADVIVDCVRRAHRR
jgi:histidinol-phosphate aminotransferase